MEIPTVETPTPLEIASDQELDPIVFSKGVVTIPRNTVIGHYPEGYAEHVTGICNYNYGSEATLNWTSSGRFRMAGLDGEFAATFYDTLTAVGYNVKGDPDILFDRRDELSKAKFHVGGRVMSIKSNICDLHSLWDGASLRKSTGELYMKIEWNVYDALERRTVAKFTTEGIAEQKRPVPDILFSLLISAFSGAAETLAADPKFLQLVSRQEFDATPADTPYAGEPIIVKRLKESRRNISAVSSRLLQATVTVRKGGGHGSGFLISKAGYILTNAHVAGDSGEVQVVFHSGLEVTGRVLRSHKVRDVTVIKVDIRGLTPLPIRSKPLRVAETVFAVGTPLREDLRSTVTKGIVSAFRKSNRTGFERIQADVDISGGNSGGPLVDEFGNVVGLSVSGIGQSGLSAGLNFFIPITSALEQLNIKLAGKE